MSILIERHKYKRMLKRRITLIEKKLKEIDEIKIKYGTFPTMGASEQILEYINEHREDLED